MRRSQAESIPVPSIILPVLVSEFDYHLPPELIAQEPLPDRAAARMLHLVRRPQAVHDREFCEFPNLLRPGDLVVLNDTRVIPARLFGRRSGARSQPVSARNPAAKDFLRGKVEVLLTRQLPSSNGEEWEALVRPGRKIGLGERLYFGKADELQAEVVGRGEYGVRRLRFRPVPDFFSVIDSIGHVPLPPYINRPDRPEDRSRYQTVFARESGSVAAPTAGLHFTSEVLERLSQRGVATAYVTLHVGLGTFQPVHEALVEQHKLHREYYNISQQAAEQINTALHEHRRIVAVGTTSVRTLEQAALIAGEHGLQAGSGESELFIYPGFQFRAVSAMLTNFHLPRSTLLMLVSAFAGKDFVLTAYRHAVQQRYRFYSYGDCMFIE